VTAPSNLHASGVIAGGHGLLVTGPSGSGKTRLCLDLIDHCRRNGAFAALVADDQILLQARSGRLIATAPQAISGLVELRGFGPAPLAHVPRMVVDRLVHLVPPEAPRLAEPAERQIHGVFLPGIDVAAGSGGGAALAVAGWLGIPPFAR